MQAVPPRNPVRSHAWGSRRRLEPWWDDHFGKPPGPVRVLQPAKGSQPQEVAPAYYPPDLMRAGGETLRPWQLEAVPLVLDTIDREPVLIEACPGAGKMHFGLEVVYRLTASGRISRVLIVVPTLGIAMGGRVPHLQHRPPRRHFHCGLNEAGGLSIPSGRTGWERSSRTSRSSPRPKCSWRTRQIRAIALS